MSAWRFSDLGEHSEAYSCIVGESLHYYDFRIWETYIRRVRPENFRLVWDGQQLVGGLAFYRCGQWYGGRSVPCAGVSGVGIDPAYRGSGACKALLIETLRELARERLPMASLYASTQRLYRSVGFEQSGTRIQYSVPMSALDSSLRGDKKLRNYPVTRVRNPDPHLLDKVTNSRGQRGNGCLKRTPGLWERIIEPIGGDSTTTYLLGDPAAPEGFITLMLRKRSTGHPAPLVASDWVAETPSALKRMLLLIQDHRSMCDPFVWHGGPQDPILLSASEQACEMKEPLWTLNRIVTLPTAFEQRGYPKGLSTELHFGIRDDFIPENSGSWTVRIEDGRGQVTQGGPGSIKCTIDALVPLYTSMFGCSQLASMGRIHCEDPAQVAAADLAFSGPAPWTAETF